MTGQNRRISPFSEPGSLAASRSCPGKSASFALRDYYYAIYSITGDQVNNKAFSHSASPGFFFIFGILFAGGGVAQAASCLDPFLIHSEQRTEIGVGSVLAGG